LTWGWLARYKSEREFAFVFHVEQFLEDAAAAAEFQPRGWKAAGIRE